MKFIFQILAITFIPAISTLAGELEDTIKTLNHNFDKLEGYEATYEVKTSDGKTGKISVGVDFASGWSYLFSELKDAEGKTIQKGQQWSTGDGLHLMKIGDQLAVFEGFGALGKRLNGLSRVLAPNKQDPSFRIDSRFYLDNTGIQMGVGFSTSGVNMFSQATKLIEKKEKTATLETSEYGLIEVDLATGLITSQLLKTDDKTRSFKRLTYTPSPGKDAIASKFAIDIEGVPRRNLSEAGMSQKFVLQAMQLLIDKAGTEKELSDTFGEYLKGIEDPFVTFLSAEPLNRSGFVKNDFLFVILDRATATTIEKLAAKGQKVTAVDILTTPASRDPLVRSLTDLFRRRAPAQKKEQYLNEVLNGKLKGGKGDRLKARILIEDLIERSYYRVRIDRGIDAYIKDLQGK